jgi:hypothetical protein
MAWHWLRVMELVDALYLHVFQELIYCREMAVSYFMIPGSAISTSSIIATIFGTKIFFETLYP